MDSYFTVRLNKALADAGFCSRRKADELIKAGRVSVNGTIVSELGLKVAPGEDQISVDGRPMSKRADNREFCYLMVHKPVQVVSTTKDPECRKTVLDLVPGRYKSRRLYPVGRLDYFSEGLLLITNDGPLTHRLTHPSFHLPKVYEVLLRERPTSAMIQTMQSGMVLAEGEKLAPVKVKDVHTGREGHTVHLTLNQGVNRQIRRMARDLGLTILRLRRISFGPLTLGDLALGHCRALSRDELQMLRKSIEALITRG